MTADILQRRLRDEIRLASDALLTFVSQDAFQDVLADMWQLPEDLRHEFVDIVLLDTNELRKRGVQRDSKIVVQRSEFSDKRPTLFCVSRSLPPGLVWKKVTVTFDNLDPSTFRMIDKMKIDNYATQASA